MLVKLTPKNSFGQLKMFLNEHRLTHYEKIKDLEEIKVGHATQRYNVQFKMMIVLFNARRQYYKHFLSKKFLIRLKLFCDAEKLFCLK